jgi:hypothetical protein
MDFKDIEDALAGTGLIVRGGFHPSADDRDEMPEGAETPETIVLIGNAGPAMWRAFAAATTTRARLGDADPLDGWTREVLTEASGRLGAKALFPFTGPPYLPFQRWALRAGGVHVSPIGPLIDPQYGLWHAYRGALAFGQRLGLPAPPTGSSPCESCADKPCLNTCPAGALTPGNYDVPACVAHISSVSSADGEDCLGGGCLARRACPVGREYIHESEQARFHMEKFLVAQS